jgi:hypothetical protein
MHEGRSVINVPAEMENAHSANTRRDQAERIEDQFQNAAFLNAHHDHGD